MLKLILLLICLLNPLLTYDLGSILKFLTIDMEKYYRNNENGNFIELININSFYSPRGDTNKINFTFDLRYVIDNHGIVGAGVIKKIILGQF
jgi:hypothetical protein